MPNPPAISVIVPCLNQAAFLPQALDSVREQTYADWECIIINDGSTDETGEIGRAYAESDPRFRYVEQENRGLSGARNRGLDQSTGRYIQFLDADDLLARTKFEIQLGGLNALPSPCVAYSASLRFGQGEGLESAEPFETLEIRTDNAAEQIARGWQIEGVIPCHAFLFDARLFRDHSIRFDETLANTEDWECWIRVFQLRPEIRFDAEPLVYYRTHDASMCWDRTAMRRGNLAAIERQIDLAGGNSEMRLILTRRIGDLFSAGRAYEFGSGVIAASSLPRQALLERLAPAWYLIRIAALGRGCVSYAASRVSFTRRGRVLRRWHAWEIFGYNLEAIRRARAGSLKERSSS